MNSLSTAPMPETNGRTGLRRWLFAWLNARGKSSYNRIMGERKQALFQELRGDVLEVGAGSGANLAYFPAGIRWIALEPNLHMHPYLQQTAKEAGRAVAIQSGTVEASTLPDASVDAVVSTLTLCSVEDPAQAMQEILRVLKPGGRFVFIEHVAATEGTRLRRVQDWIQPAWSFVADGCRPNRETGMLIENAGFAQVTMEHFHLPIGVEGPHIAGSAIKGEWL